MHDEPAHDTGHEASPPRPHPSSSTALLRFFNFAHLPPKLQAVSEPICQLALQMECQLPDGPEKTAGLRKLLEAKDCFVRAVL